MKYNKQILLLITISIFLLTSTFAQNTPNLSDIRQDSLRIQANRMAYAFLTLDTSTFITYSDKGIIDSFFNGEKNVGSSIEAGKRDAETMGFKNLNIEIGEASKVAIVGKQMYAFVQTNSTALIKEDTVKSQSFYLAISNDSGLNWHFIDQSFITIAGIKKVFPNYDEQIAMPITKEPIFIQKR